MGGDQREAGVAVGVEDAVDQRQCVMVGGEFGGGVLGGEGAVELEAGEFGDVGELGIVVAALADADSAIATRKAPAANASPLIV